MYDVLFQIFKNYKLKTRNHELRNIVFLFLFFITVQLFSQTRIASPYSYFGLGAVEFNSYRPNSGMGGLSVAYRDPGYVNYINPASYSAFDSSSFVFQTGVRSDYNQQQTDNTKQTSNFTTLSYLLLGFPNTNWWHSSIGFFPYSNVGYKISETVKNPFSGNIDYLLEGNGGIRNFYIGNSFRLNKHFSVGFNISYLLGSIDRTQFVTIPDSINNLNIEHDESIVPNDFYFNYGLQYTTVLGKDLTLDIGATYANAKNIKATKSIVDSRFAGNYDTPIIYDTIANNKLKGNFKIPQYIGFGFVLQKKDKWLAGADAQMQQWSKFESFGIKDSLTDSWQIAIGGELIPDNSSLSSYWKKIHYRFGFHYANNNLVLNNTQIHDYGFSLGFVFPIKRSKTNLSLSLDLGRRGTTSNSLIREDYAKFTFCINVYEKWFFKRKYD